MLWENIEFLVATSISPRIGENQNSKPKTLEGKMGREIERERERKNIEVYGHFPLVNKQLTRILFPK